MPETATRDVTAAARDAVVTTGVSSTELRLAAALRAEIEAHARDGHPLEVCGLLVGRVLDARNEVERVVRARNLNRERAGDRYELAPEDFLAADAAARRDGLEIVGIWHSHPDCPARPSRTDLEAAWSGYSYVIVGVTAAGETDVHSWRLEDGRFVEERIEPAPPRAVAAALELDRPLKEEQR